MIFDLDGTLVHFHHAYLFEQTLGILERLGRTQVERSLLESCFAAFDYFQFVVQEERDYFIEQFWNLFDWSGFPKPLLIPGAYECIEQLVERGIPAAIATSRCVPVPTLVKDLEHTRLPNIVSYVTSRSGDHIHWTDKRSLIQEVCRELSVDPSEALMVGDIPTDVTSARDCGITTTVAVLSGGIRRDVLTKVSPTYILEDVSGLLEIIG